MTADDTVTAKLAEWEALVEGATPGEWTPENESDPAIPDATEFWWVAAGEIPLGTKADAEFIAAAREMVPALLGFVEDVRRILTENRHEVIGSRGLRIDDVVKAADIEAALTKRIGGEA